MNALLALWAVAHLLAAGVATAPVPAARGIFEACDQERARAPALYESYVCYYKAALRAGAMDEAARRLEQLSEEGGGGGWPLLVRAHVAGTRQEGSATTGELYRAAAERLAAEGRPLGEVIARTNLRRIRLARGDRAGADAEVEAALRAAERSGDREVLVRASVLEASHLTELGEDLGRAHRALIRAEAAVFPDGPDGLQQSVLRQSANLSFLLGRYDEAIEKLERLLALIQEVGDRSALVALRFNVANTRRAQREERPVTGSLEEVRGLAEEALTTARDAQDHVVAARTHALLADLLAQASPREAAEHGRLCLDEARGLETTLAEMECLSSTAKLQAAERPAESQRALDRAARLALAGENDMFAAYVWQARLRTAWDVRPPAEAARESLRALDAVERLRAAQGDPEARIHVFANWTKDYYWLGGRFLVSEPPDVDGAFAVAERMRARVLLESLDAAGIAPAARSDGAIDAIRARVVAVQRRLLDPALEGAARKSLLAELERNELEEADARHRAAGETGRGAPGAIRLSTLGEVRAALQPDEVLLVFLLGLDRDLYGGFGGGAWALAVTRGDVRAWRVPDRMRLETAVPVFTGLLSRRDGSEAAASAALHRDLLGGGAALLGPHIRRLVIAPDGILNELPFAALRGAPGETPLGARYEISLVPSATLWARWRSRPDTHMPAAALVFADPEPRRARSTPDAERGGALAQALALGPLPYARREGRRVRRAVGGESRLLSGSEATEAALKGLPLAPFGILHFATHAVADEAYPDRSAVLLEPGSEAEDGLLQPPEVSSLDLAGRAVVLSACRTAAGPVAGGEGVLSLARSFFEGGARTVVASRWRLRDDEAERFFAVFYDQLSRGHAMGEALRLARAEAIAQGMPAATWASVELLGDAGLALDGRRTSAGAPAPLSLLLLVAAAGIFAWSIGAGLRLNRRRGSSGPGI